VTRFTNNSRADWVNRECHHQKNRAPWRAGGLGQVMEKVKTVIIENNTDFNGTTGSKHNLL